MSIVQSERSRPSGFRMAKRSKQRSCIAQHRLTKAVVEALEQRFLLSVVNWTGDAGDGLWSTPGNWSTKTSLPGAGDSVVINALAGTTIELTSSLTASAQSVSTNATLQIDSGATLAANTIQASANIVLSGGTIQGATVAESGGSELVLLSGGTLNNVTVSAGTVLDATQQWDAQITILNGLTLNGTLEVGGADGSTFAYFLFNGTQMLGGTGSVVFGNYYYYYYYTNGLYAQGDNGANPATLTVGSGITIDGGNGDVSGYYSGDAIVNQGTIDADVAGGTIYVANNGSGLSNSGTLEATAGTLNVGGGSTPWSNGGNLIVSGTGVLDLGGVFTQAGLGTFTRTGGTVNLTGTLTGNLALSSATGSWNLAGGTIAGGTVTATGGAELVLTGSGGTLDGVTIGSGTVLDGTQQ